MIKITKTTAPECLEDLKSNLPNATYEDLQNPCKTEVTTKLFLEQKGLCAYCQRDLKNNVFIEHYIPQNSALHPRRTSIDDLDYDNFLGVCSGYYYLNKKTGEKIICCDKSRKNDSLLVTPLKKAYITTIYYDDKNKICSTDVIIHDDLNKTLNLNFEELCFDREVAFEEELEIIQNMAIEMGLSPIIAYKKGIKSILDRKKSPEFSGFLLYRLKQGLAYKENIKTKNKVV